MDETKLTKDSTLQEQPHEWSIVGKVCLITGGGAGIGRVTSVELMKRGLDKIIIADINTTWGEETAAEIQKACNFNDEELKRRVAIKYLDLASLNSVRQFANEILAMEPRLEVLINNAGINPPPDRRVSEDGFEFTFATNFLGHFLLTNLLLDLLKKSAPSRIVALASDAYMFCWPKGIRLNDLQIEKRRFDFWEAYSHSKLAILMTMRKLSIMMRAENCDVSVYMVHPGMVYTDILKHRSKAWQFFVNKIVHPLKFIVITVQNGAKTPIHCATAPGIERYSGKYFTKKRPTRLWSIAKNAAKADQLWQICETYCNEGFRVDVTIPDRKDIKRKERKREQYENDHLLTSEAS